MVQSLLAADALLAPGKTTIINPENTFGYQTYLNFDPAGTIENQGTISFTCGL